MSLTSRLIRIGRLATAPLRGFFSWKTETVMPVYDPERTSFAAHLKELARQDTVLYFEPFRFAVRAFKQERAKPY
jgi:hypothetical protein